ncbi:hypothetical protein DKM19_43520 [Streptosporangium sp. 'caverna']|nr:hypothetical protein DKM19_43520 [Streptosporangium sp. 'caverna']
MRGKEFDEATAIWNDAGSTPHFLREPEQISRFLGGREPVEPGVASCPPWRTGPAGLDIGHEVDEFCAVGRKL